MVASVVLDLTNVIVKDHSPSLVEIKFKLESSPEDLVERGGT